MRPLALLLASLATALVLALPWALRPPVRVRTRAGARTVTLPPSWRLRRRRGPLRALLANPLLPWPLPLLARVLILDADGPAARRFRWRMIHAGLSGQSVAWFRRTQLAMAAICAAPLGAGLLTGLLPGAVVGPWLLASLAIGILAPLLMLSHRAAQRRQTFRRELVGILYDLAGLVTAGMTLEAALHELAGEEGDLHAELRAALVLTGAGVALDETLSQLIERCATAEVTGALRRIITARENGEKRVAPALGEMASSLTAQLRSERRTAKARAMLASIGLLALFGLPPVIVVVLYPVAVQVFAPGR